MSFRYNLPHSVTLGPQRHSFLRYPTVPIRPLGSATLPPEPTTADTVLKWAFWIGAGFAAVQVFDKLARKPAWEMNPTKEEKAILLRRALELYEPGSNISQLAGYLNMSVATLTNWLKKEGVYVSSRFSRYKKFNAARRKANKRLKILRESYGVSATPVVSVDAAQKECTFNGYDIPRIDDKDFRKRMRLLSKYTAKELPPYIAQYLAIVEGDIDAAMIYIAKSRNMEGTILFLLGEARFYKEKELYRFLLCTGVGPPAAWKMNPRRRDERLFQEALRRYVPGQLPPAKAGGL